MDWLSSMGLNDFHQPHDEDFEEDNEEDFYDNGTMNEQDATAGATSGDANHLLNTLLPAVIKAKTEQTTSQEARKAENQKKAEMLRAQLLAKRQNTPMKAASSRAETPAAKGASTPHPPQMIQQQKPSTMAKHSLSDNLGLDQMIEEARVAADVKAKDQPTINGMKDQNQSILLATPKSEVKPANNIQQPPELETSIQQQPQAELITDKPKPESCPQQLKDPYFTDLAAWLEITGYHDVSYRTAKLRTYKQRKALEEEAARIAEKLEELRRQEQEEMEALRSSTFHLVSQRPDAPPPALPTHVPASDAVQMAAVASKLTNGVKRAHSPAPVDRTVKRRGEPPSTDGFRIRGANESPTEAHRPPFPKMMERRISYSDARRPSLDDARSRDPSLERRQGYYKREGERPGPPPRADSRYDQYTPQRDSRVMARAEYSLGGYASAPRPHTWTRSDHQHQQFRGSAGLELPKGGQSTSSVRRELMR
ncbi:hypothetical protein BAUCODRAFT_23144 [Baudoinia panamericana UAMH 10762]|uniref:Uncharacterized protein n=1 Tax=Baudoinia panamericana (strain UAMH 10762) TaxID=717646 RepID=M2LUS3_BAUPA|nr:uncharacterized protein BAUCODRAFT_23144 [Baudoinia panamericana UAMH 10762]EMC98357.1 hypothetical protein BAUCODRAFT_23144 [Baudoinia panamericana UAMH 10762]